MTDSPATHTANDILHIVKRVSDYLTTLEEAGGWRPTDHDTDEELVHLHAALVGISVPRDAEPSKGLSGLLRTLCGDVDTALHARLAKDKVEIAGFEVERKGPSYSNSWDLPRAVEEVAIAALVTADGEIKHTSPIEAANTVANAILQTSGISYMRVTEGDKFGVDLRKFRDRGVQTSPAGVIVRGHKPVES